MDAVLYISLGFVTGIFAGILGSWIYRTAVMVPSMFPLQRRRRLQIRSENPYTAHADEVAFWDFVRRAKNDRNLAMSYEPRLYARKVSRPSAKIIPFRRPEADNTGEGSPNIRDAG